MRVLGAVCIAVLALGGMRPAWPADRSCWIDMPGKPVAPEVTCVALTERLLTSLEGASKAQVVKIMGAAGGRTSDGASYHYMSNHIGKPGRSGDVNITFENDRAVIVSAMLDPEDSDARSLEFIWNAREGGCSDFPGSRRRCAE